MKTKEQAIKEAYGKHWDKLPIEIQKQVLEKNGWINSKEWIGDAGNTLIFNKLKGISLDCMDNYHSTYCYYFRPKSLKGIKDNNGWIKIESDDDLPKETIKCIVCFFDGKNYIEGSVKYRTPELIYSLKQDVQITHYKPIEKIEQPIY